MPSRLPSPPTAVDADLQGFERFMNAEASERGQTEPLPLPPHIIAILPEAEVHAYAQVPEMRSRLEAVRPALEALCAAATRPGRSKRSRLEAIRQAAQMVSEAVLPVSGCRTQCNSCCHIPVALSQAEANLIATEIGRPARKLPRRYTMPTAYGYSLACPFLRAGRCSIYEHRPVACRLHLSLDINDRLCRLIPDVAVPVPLADVRQFNEVYVLANGLDEPIGDIRHFFGNSPPQK